MGKSAMQNVTKTVILVVGCLGGSGPPESISIIDSSIDLPLFLTAFAMVCAGLLLTISFCFLNIKWRNNK